MKKLFAALTLVGMTALLSACIPQVTEPVVEEEEPVVLEVEVVEPVVEEDEAAADEVVEDEVVEDEVAE